MVLYTKNQLVRRQFHISLILLLKSRNYAEFTVPFEEIVLHTPGKDKVYARDFKLFVILWGK